MHLAELIIQTHSLSHIAERYYASGHKGMSAKVLIDLSEIISSSVTGGADFSSYTEPMPDENVTKLQQPSPQNEPTKQTSEAEQSSQEADKLPEENQQQSANSNRSQSQGAL